MVKMRTRRTGREKGKGMAKTTKTSKTEWEITQLVITRLFPDEGDRGIPGIEGIPGIKGIPRLCCAALCVRFFRLSRS